MAITSRTLAASLTFFFVQACSSNQSSLPGDADPPDAMQPDAMQPDAGPSLVSVTVLMEGHWADVNRDYQLLALKLRNGGTTYAQWFPPNASSGPRPVVIAAAPYAGIDWTGEEVDARWAANNGSAGCYPDVDSPGYVAGVSADTCYMGTVTPDQSGSQIATTLFNNVGGLIVFGRFYAGIPLDAAVSGFVAASEFLAGLPGTVDCSRIATTGSSLGGFEALHGAAMATPNCKPVASVGLAPLLDLGNETQYFDQELPSLLANAPAKLKKYSDFFEPYRRRIEIFAGSGSVANYEPYTLSFLSSLPTDTLVIQDTWDTLVPVGTAEQLVAQGNAEGFWFTHTSAINFELFSLDHSQAGTALDSTVVNLFSDLYALLRIVPSSEALTVLYSASAFTAFMNTMHTQSNSGDDLSWLTPRLIELVSSRVTLFNIDDGMIGQTISGANLLGPLLNQMWNAALPVDSFATAVPQYLSTHTL